MQIHELFVIHYHIEQMILNFLSVCLGWLGVEVSCQCSCQQFRAEVIELRVREKKSLFLTISYGLGRSVFFAPILVICNYVDPVCNFCADMQLHCPNYNYRAAQICNRNFPNFVICGLLLDYQISNYFRLSRVVI